MGKGTTGDRGRRIVQQVADGGRLTPKMASSEERGMRDTSTDDIYRDMRASQWLPTTKKEAEVRGWDEVDVVLFSGDAYVDHPSFGVAVIGRTLEAMGLRVAIVPQPDWHGDYRDFRSLAVPACSSA